MSNKQFIAVESALRELRKFPTDVRLVMGQALFDAQTGGKHPDAKPLKGFKGAAVLQSVDNYNGDTYRAIYTIKIKNAVYLLHAFQKKSKKGIKTSKQDMDLVKQRLNDILIMHKDY